MSGVEATRYWWCLDHQQVEGDEGCPNSVRLGPFEKYEDAEHAIELAQKRTEAWDNDEAWSDDSSDSDDRDDKSG